jgi:hypothetical protein
MNPMVQIDLTDTFNIRQSVNAESETYFAQFNILAVSTPSFEEMVKLKLYGYLFLFLKINYISFWPIS